MTCSFPPVSPCFSCRSRTASWYKSVVAEIHTCLRLPRFHWSRSKAAIQRPAASCCCFCWVFVWDIPVHCSDLETRFFFHIQYYLYIEPNPIPANLKIPSNSRKSANCQVPFPQPVPSPSKKPQRAPVERLQPKRLAASAMAWQICPMACLLGEVVLPWRFLGTGWIQDLQDPENSIKSVSANEIDMCINIY